MTARQTSAAALFGDDHLARIRTVGIQETALSSHEAEAHELLGAMAREATTGERTWVYFIAGEHAIKIGVARDPWRRLRELQTASPEPLRLVTCWWGSRKLEREIHRRFAHLRAHGEWFRADVALLALVQQIAALTDFDLQEEEDTP